MSAAELRAGYLDELGQHLQPLTPVERIGVVDAVRTHLDAQLAALGTDPTDAEAQRVLDRLGEPELVAERVLAGEDAVPRSEQAPAPDPAPAPAPSAAAPPASSLPEPTAPPSSTTARASLADIPRMEWPEEPMPRPGLTRAWVPLVVVAALLLGSFFLMFLIPLVLLVIGWALLWASPLWSRRDKVIGTIVPTVALGAFLPSIIGLSQEGEGGVMTVPTAGLLGLAVAALAGVATLIWLAARGRRQSRTLDQQFPAGPNKQNRSSRR